jgi:hypothetical protein
MTASEGKYHGFAKDSEALDSCEKIYNVWRSSCTCEVYRYHCWPSDVRAVVEHSNDKSHNEWGGQSSALIPGKHTRRRKWFFQRHEGFPADEEHQRSEASDKESNHFRVVRRCVLHENYARQDHGSGGSEGDHANIVEMSHRLVPRDSMWMPGREIKRSKDDE